METDKSLNHSRLILACLALVASIALRACNLLSDTSFMQIMIWVTGLFIAGDVGGAWMSSFVQTKVVATQLSANGGNKGAV